MIKKIVGLVMAGFVISEAFATTSISISADAWYPFTAKEEGAYPGYLIEIAQEIFKEKNIDVVYKVQPWERALVSVINKEINCVAGAAKTEAPDFLYPEKAQGISVTSFYVKKGNPWRYNGSLDSLKEVKLAVMGGYAYDSGALDEYIKANENTNKVQTVKAVDALDQNIKKIISDRVDVIIESDAVFLSKISTLGLENQFENAGVVGAQELYIACGPNDPANVEYVKILSDGMSKLKASGKLKEIFEHYKLDIPKELLDKI
jgi:polar amino acid transport system substrate-binding protein